MPFPHQQAWGEEEKAAFRILLERKYNARKIAAELSQQLNRPITRNAILGLKKRMGLATPTPIGPRKPRERKPRHGRPRLTRAERRLEQMPRPPIAPPIPFLDRAQHQCPYPVEGEGLGMLCCGADRYRYGGGTIKRTWLPYCHYHCHVAFRWQDGQRDAC